MDGSECECVRAGSDGAVIPLRVGWSVQCVPPSSSTTPLQACRAWLDDDRPRPVRRLRRRRVDADQWRRQRAHRPHLPLPRPLPPHRLSWRRCRPPLPHICTRSIQMQMTHRMEVLMPLPPLPPPLRPPWPPVRVQLGGRIAAEWPQALAIPSRALPPPLPLCTPTPLLTSPRPATPTPRRHPLQAGTTAPAHPLLPPPPPPQARRCQRLRCTRICRCFVNIKLYCCNGVSSTQSSRHRSRRSRQKQWSVTR